MKGQNKLILNQATMIEALQEWCDEHLADEVLVTGITEMKAENTFEIRTSDKQEEPK